MSSNETPTIKPMTDGPYIVKSLQRFSNQKVQSTRKIQWLCAASNDARL